MNTDASLGHFATGSQSAVLAFRSCNAQRNFSVYFEWKATRGHPAAKKEPSQATRGHRHLLEGRKWALARAAPPFRTLRPAFVWTGTA